MMRRLPLILTVVFIAWALSGLRVPKDKSDTFAVNEFGRLPVVANGRYQPLDSLARNSLLQLREKQSVNCEPWKGMFAKPKMLSATEWLMEMTMNPQVADTRPVFRIDNPDLKGLLGVPMEADEAKQTDGKHFSWQQISVKLQQLQDASKQAASKDEKQRTPFEQAVIRLSNLVGLYMKLQNTIQPQNARDWAAELNQYQAAIEPGRQAAMAQNAGKEYDAAALERLMHDLQRFDAMMAMEPPLIIPPHRPDQPKDKWVRTGEALMDVARGDTPSFALTGYARMATAYRSNSVQGFNDAVREYRAGLNSQYYGQLSKATWEQRFNFFQPFYKAMNIFAAAGLLALAFWVRPVAWETLRKAAVWLVLSGLCIHLIGLFFRMALEGRPPVTNLYSSAIFIGFGAAVLGVILEAFWRNGIGVVVSCVCAFSTLIIAHHLSFSGDTMEMMRAVLDTNFWLATHVVVVTLGYSATFVAGVLAMIFVIRGVFTASLDQPTAKSLNKMIYGIVCFATLFSFVGTVLGGIWADQSWGRFWGWDAKENGALMIVLWNALVLHARWGALVRDRGLMALVLGGNIVTSWSWFGVNMLGIGLHSYGFMDAAFWWLMFFVATQLALMVTALLPLSMWKSFQHLVPARPTTSPGKDEPQTA